LMRGPYEPGYRDREPILVSVSAARPGVKACDSRLVSNCSSPAKRKFTLAGALRTDMHGYTLSGGPEVAGKIPAKSKIAVDIFCAIYSPQPTANVSPSSI
jgi:hypothetical protein